MDYTAVADLVATPTKPTPKSKRRGSKSNQDDPQADPPRPKRRPIVGGGGKFVGMKEYGRVGAEGTGAPSPKSSPSPVPAPESPPSFAHSKVGRTTEPPPASPPPPQIPTILTTSHHPSPPLATRKRDISAAAAAAIDKARIKGSRLPGAVIPGSRLPGASIPKTNPGLPPPSPASVVDAPGLASPPPTSVMAEKHVSGALSATKTKPILPAFIVIVDQLT